MSTEGGPAQTPRRPDQVEDMMLGLGIIGWIIVGGLAGWIASMIMKTNAQMGILLNIVVGIVGGLLGGFILALLGVDVEGGGLIFSFVTCLAGACLLLWVVGLVRGRSKV